MKEKHTRSLAKTISWRILASVDTIVISYLVTSSVVSAFSIGVIEFITKIFLYYGHERLWNKTNFGKL